MKYSFRGISWNMKCFHEILLLFFSSIKKSCLQRKDVFWWRKFIIIFVTHKTKTKKFKQSKTSLNENMTEQKDRSAYFQNLSVNWQIPALSSNECYIILLIIHWFSYIDIFILLTLIPLQHALITSSYIDFYNSLHSTRFTFYK